MAVTVVVNYMTASHKGSNGTSIAFPDVCKTPVLGVPVPIPYPNIAQSSDLADGSKDVKFDGESVVLKSSNLKRSMGDEAGVQMGIISNQQMGKAEFLNYSFDVKVEGQNVCRLGDPASGNASSLNTASFFHLQEPASVQGVEAELIKDACSGVESNAAAQKSKSPKSRLEESGIIPEHRTAIQDYVNNTPLFVLYFRNTSRDCEHWIRAEHMPKPHAVTDGKTLKKGREADLLRWIRDRANWYTIPFLRAMDEICRARPRLTRLGQETTPLSAIVAALTIEDLEPLYGVVVRTGALKGRPQLGYGSELGLSFEDKWMTGDYDLMDVLTVGEQCTRPNRVFFEGLRFDINQAVGWPCIQHPMQSVWNTRKDREYKGEREFNVREAIDVWLQRVEEPKRKALEALENGNWKRYTAQTEKAAKAAKAVPAAPIAPGNPPNKLIDDQLTVIAPGGGLYLETNEDYWDALVCCGCLDADRPVQGPEVEPDIDETEVEEHRPDGKFKPDLFSRRS